jgi:ubiquinone biosynthesis protein UbiJ
VNFSRAVLFFGSSIMTPSLISAAINHLLAQEAWARKKLAAHAGKTACFDTGIATIKLQAGADGLVQAADTGAVPAVTIRVKPADLPLIVQNRERAFSYVKVEGDAEFANTISRLAQSLRWDAEGDASRVLGDIGGARLTAGARSILDGARAARQKLLENLSEYFIEENPMLVRPDAVADFTDQVNSLRDDAERLAKRIARLERMERGEA